MFVLPLFSNAQKSLRKKQDRIVLKKIDEVITKGFKHIPLKDSIALYALNFRIEIVKRKGGRTTVMEVRANDSIAYRLFPFYKRLYSVDYSVLMGTRKKITLVIPILIANVSATAKKRYSKDDGTDLIEMDAAVNAAFALYSTIPYDNVIEAKVPIGHRVYKQIYQRNDADINTHMIYLMPHIITVLNIS